MAKRYTDELMTEVNTDREEHGKKVFDDDSVLSTAYKRPMKMEEDDSI